MQSIVSMVAPQLHNVDIEDMAPNSGATVQKGLRKVAVYKDEEGKKHAFSALCPHLGCLLQVSVGGFPLNILPFAFWAAFCNLVVMPVVMTSCTLALFRVSFAQPALFVGLWYMLGLSLTVLRLLCMLWSRATLGQPCQSKLKGWSNFKGWTNFHGRHYRLRAFYLMHSPQFTDLH